MRLSQKNGDITGYRLEVPDDGSDCLECLRPHGHEGPHLVKRADARGGAYYLWERIICDDCDCSGAESFSWDDCCVAYGTITLEEAQ